MLGWHGRGTRMRAGGDGGRVDPMEMVVRRVGDM
jgi:hypothetical protein